MNLKLNILIITVLIGSASVANAQNNLYDFDRFTPKSPNEIFIGTILEAKSLNENSYHLIDVALNPITISYSFGAKSQTIIPSRASMMNAIQSSIAESNKLKENYSFSYQVKELNSYNELALYMRQDIDNELLFGIFSNTRRKNTIAVTELSQTFFTIEMDMPDVDGLCADASLLEPYDKDQLIFINSISFGKKIVVVTESDAAFSKLKPAIEYMIQKATDETIKKDAELESIFMNSTVRIMIVGNESVEMTDVNNPFIGLVNYISQKVNAEHFGVPVLFSAAYLKNNGMFVNQITIK